MGGTGDTRNRSTGHPHQQSAEVAQANSDSYQLHRRRSPVMGEGLKEDGGPDCQQSTGRQLSSDEQHKRWKSCLIDMLVLYRASQDGLPWKNVGSVQVLQTYNYPHIEFHMPIGMQSRKTCERCSTVVTSNNLRVSGLHQQS